jgi:ubiquinone/menaquinone biosynthesis C-methylase UbiE
MKKPIQIRDVRSFWSTNPLCAADIPYPLGTREYFSYFDQLREEIESLEFSYGLHEYTHFIGKKVLDVGCGNGYVLSKYAHEGAEVYGVDLTATAVDLCHHRFELLGLQGNFYQANAEELPFKDQSFECICSMGVLHHTPNPEKAIAEIFRILKPGGRLIVMFYYRDSALYRLRYPLMSLLTGKTVQQLVNEADGVGNPKGDIYSKNELRHLLRDFEQLEMEVGFLTGRMVLPKIGHLIPKSLLKLLEKQWGWNLYAKAFKKHTY